MKCALYCVSAVAIAALVACSSSSPSSGTEKSGTGGSGAVGGNSSSATSTANGGSTAKGGASNTSDSTGAGGTPSSVSSSSSSPSNSTSSGGSSSSSGDPSSGGSSKPPNASSAGGTKSSSVASVPSAGGAKSGGAGAPATGGTKSTTAAPGAAGKVNGSGGAQGGAATQATSSVSPGGAAGASATTPTTGTAGAGTTIKLTKKFIGNTSPKNKDIPADFATMWEQVSLDANSKWGFVQPDSADKWVWEPVDQVYKYAKENGLIFKEHNFFWNYEQPSWVNDSNVMTVGPKWVEAFCKRYPDVPMIDVVNEPMTGHNPAPYAKGMGGAGTTGYDWVITAFKWARQYCPNSVLIINDFNIIEWEDDHNTFVDMLTKLLAAGAPIDAIGAQGHDVYKAGVPTVKGYIDKLTETFHLPIYITEFEINEADDAKQLGYMQEAIPMFYDHPNVMGITYWGYIKGMMWNQRPNGWLVDTNGKQRPAMTWLQDFIKSKK